MKVTYIKLAKIKKLNGEAKYVVPVNREGNRIEVNGTTLKKMGGYAGKEIGTWSIAVNEQIIDKINELVEAVNELRKSSHE